MELSVKDRLLLPSIFPKEGSFAEFNLKKSINEKISFGDSERKKLNLRQDDERNMIVWDEKKETKLVADFTADEQAYLKKCCEMISDQSLQDEMWVVVAKIYDSVSLK